MCDDFPQAFRAAAVDGEPGNGEEEEEEEEERRSPSCF